MRIQIYRSVQIRYSWRMEQTTRQALSAIATTSRNLADALDKLLDGDTSITSQSPLGGAGSLATRGREQQDAVWDPEVDEPLVEPKVVGTREEQDWCCLTYLGGIYAINKRYNRGANKHEVREYAMKAGYRDGRAVTAWSKGNGATQNDEEKQRWVTDAGVNYWVKGLAEKHGVALPADLADPWDAPNFR